MKPRMLLRELKDMIKAKLRMKPKTYYSQDGQDYFIANKIFRNMREGTFVEIGANDGITFSNTYYMERDLGWKGVCVEPHPGSFQRLTKNRSCILVNAAIANKKTVSTFLRIDGYAEMLSGLVETYEQDHLRRIEQDMQTVGGHKEEIQVACYSFEDILGDNNIGNVDYLSIDTEGGEYEILSSIDFNKIKVGVISVEVRGSSAKYDDLLLRHAYKKVKVLGSDHIYIRTKN